MASHRSHRPSSQYELIRDPDDFRFEFADAQYAMQLLVFSRRLTKNGAAPAAGNPLAVAASSRHRE